MAHVLGRRRLAYFIVAAAAVGASAARADVDTTGYWSVQETTFLLPPIVEYWTQTGTTVTTAGFSGTIDSGTGAFSMTGPFGICPVDTLVGSAALDNQTWTGTEVEHFPGSPTLCFDGVELSLSAERIPSTCGDGVVDPGEECDDGNLMAGDGCSPTCRIETCYVCSGAPSVCAPASVGSACDDGDACTVNACDGSGSCIVTAQSLCNDDNPCTIDSCVHPSGCVYTPDVRSCRSALVDSLGVTDVTLASRDKLGWKWQKGDATSQSDFGTPAGTTSYTLCVFAGTTSAVVGEAEIPPNSQKWSAIGQRGFKYKDPGGAADGISGIALIGGAAGKAKIMVKGKGIGLSLNPPPYSLPLSVQLTNSSTSACWGATFEATDVKNNAPGAFRAKSKSP